MAQCHKIRRRRGINKPLQVAGKIPLNNYLCEIFTNFFETKRGRRSRIKKRIFPPPFDAF
jgi:hypothetical protein